MWQVQWVYLEGECGNPEDLSGNGTQRFPDCQGVGRYSRILRDREPPMRADEAWADRKPRKRMRKTARAGLIALDHQ